MIRARPAEKRQWTPPPAPGPTLRQVIERNEREMGLRCSDVSCGLGPSDEDPVSSIDLSALRQISIQPLKSDTSDKEAVCEHSFHPACLVSAERVAGWGHEVMAGEPAGEVEDVEVSCPVCRAMGVISRLEWEEGVPFISRAHLIKFDFPASCSPTTASVTSGRLALDSSCRKVKRCR